MNVAGFGDGIPTLSSDADEWMIDLFGSRAAKSGGVVRRKSRDIERYVGRVEFEQELARRGFHAIENAGQTVIFFNQEPIRVIR